MTTVSIKGIPKAKVLAALYNRSTPRGMGFLQAKPGDMTEAQAAELLKTQTYFDYLQGRVMKIDLDDDDNLYTGLYNRDLGHGAAEAVIESLREPNVQAVAIDYQPCKSSQISHFGYDAESKTLGVKFTRGGTYHYKEVPPEVFDKFIACPSAGSFHGSQIRGVYEYERQPDPKNEKAGDAPTEEAS